MSIPITDKADNVSIFVDNMNRVTETVNKQLDSSVLANLSTEIKDSLVGAINELNNNKISTEGDIKFLGNIAAKSFNAKDYHVGADENNNAYIKLLDVKTNIEVNIGWNGEKQKWVITDTEGKEYDILTGGAFDFNDNVSPLVLKSMNGTAIEQYIGPAGELVINSSNYSDIRIQDGQTAGGNSVSGKGSVKIRRLF